MATGYASALSAAVWRNDLAAIVLALIAVVLAAASYRNAVGRRRHDRLVVLEVAAGLAGVVVLGVLVRLVFPAADVAVPLLLAYEVAMIMAAARLEIGLTPATAGSVTDLVVDLGMAEPACCGTPSPKRCGTQPCVSAIGIRTGRVSWTRPASGSIRRSRAAVGR